MTIQELRKMNAAELVLKKSYIDSPERHLNQPCAQEAVLDVILPAFWHQHNFFELTFVLEGHCTNNIIGNTFTMRKGDLCIMAPNVTNAISAF